MTSELDLPDIRRRLDNAMSVQMTPERVAARLSELRHAARAYIPAMTTGISPRQLLALAQDLAENLPPDTAIVRNSAGNIAWSYPNGSFGWADLDTGEVHLPDQDSYQPDGGTPRCGRPLTVGDQAYLPGWFLYSPIIGEPGRIVSVEDGWAIVDRGDWGEFGCPVDDLRSVTDGPAQPGGLRRWDSFRPSAAAPGRAAGPQA